MTVSSLFKNSVGFVENGKLNKYVIVASAGLY